MDRVSVRCILERWKGAGEVEVESLWKRVVEEATRI
jgi:hypothetical protein